MDQHYDEEERKRLEYYWADRDRMAGAYQYVPPDEAYPAEALADHNDIEDPRLHDNYHDAAQGAHENPFHVEPLGQNFMPLQRPDHAFEAPVNQQGQNDAIQAEHYPPIDPELEIQALIAVQAAGNPLNDPHVAHGGNPAHPNFGDPLPDYIYDVQASAMNIQPGDAGQIDNLLQDGFNLPYLDLGPVAATPAEFGDPAMFVQEYEQWQHYNNQVHEQYGQQMVDMQAQLQYHQNEHGEDQEHQHMPNQQYPQHDEYHIHEQGHHNQDLHQQHDHHAHQDHAFDQPRQKQNHHDDNEDVSPQQDDAQNAAAALNPLAQDNNPQPAANVQAPQARHGRRSHTRTIAGSQFNDGTPDPNPDYYGLAKVSPRPPCRELPRMVKGAQKVVIQCNRCNKILSRKDEMRWHLRRDHYGKEYGDEGFHIEKGRQQALLDCPK